MSHIKTILKAEARADHIKSRTEREVKAEIENAELKADKELSDLRASLNHEQKQALTEQKQNLKKIYIEIKDQGQKEIDKLTETVAKNQERAVRSIVQNLTN